MKLRRLLQLTSSVAAAIVMTACGGGGETGPAWAQNTQKVLTTPPGRVYVKAPAAYADACNPAVGGYSLQKVIVPISDTGSLVTLEVNIRYFRGEDCVDTNRLFTIRQPAFTLTVDGTIEGPVSDTPTRQVTANFPAGINELVIDADNVRAEFDANGDYAIFVDGDTVGLRFDRQAAGDSYKDLFLIYDGFMFFGDSKTIVEGSPYPTELLTNTNVFEFLP